MWMWKEIHLVLPQRNGGIHMQRTDLLDRSVVWNTVKMLMRTYASTFVHNPTGKPIQMELCMIVLNVLNVVLLADSDFFVLAHYE